MTIFLIFSFGILFLSVFVVWSLWQPSGRNLGLEDLSGKICYLLAHKENGAFYRLDHHGSSIWFSFERVSGSGRNAILALRIPRNEMTESIREKLRQTFSSSNFEFIEEDDNPSLLAKVFISIDDIRDEASGARGAYAGRLLVDALGLPLHARFSGKEYGATSMRALEPNLEREDQP